MKQMARRTDKGRREGLEARGLDRGRAGEIRQTARAGRGQPAEIKWTACGPDMGSEYRDPKRTAAGRDSKAELSGRAGEADDEGGAAQEAGD